jgi:hypothetical protein
MVSDLERNLVGGERFLTVQVRKLGTTSIPHTAEIIDTCIQQSEEEPNTV